MENYSLSDIGAVTGGSGFGGGNSAWVLIILFALIFGWGGNGFGANRMGEFGQFATSASQSEILLGQKFDSLSRQINQVGDGLCSSTYALNNSILGEGRAIQTQLAECCCTTQRGIDSVNYNGAINTAAINANTTAQTQKILDAICQNKIETLQGQVNQLQLQNAMNGVVRYPNGWTYNAGTSPFCACNGCGTI